MPIGSITLSDEEGPRETLAEPPIWATSWPGTVSPVRVRICVICAPGSHGRPEVRRCAAMTYASAIMSLLRGDLIGIFAGCLSWAQVPAIQDFGPCALTGG